MANRLGDKMLRKYSSKKGMMGVGTLIIFIAIILVAAVAASVLISTAGSLQQKALMTGSQSEEQVASGVEAVSLMATDGTTNHSIDHFEFTVRLGSGSVAVNLNNTVLTFDTQDIAQSLDYNTTISKHLLDEEAFAAGTHFYSVQYLKTGPDWEQGYITRGDVVKFVFNSAEPVKENKIIRLKIIPRVGQLTQVDVYTPDTMVEKRVHLWPS